MTRAGLAELDRALEALPDEELDALVERARQRAGDLLDERLATLIADALCLAHGEGRP